MKPQLYAPATVLPLQATVQYNFTDDKANRMKTLRGSNGAVALIGMALLISWVRDHVYSKRAEAGDNRFCSSVTAGC